MKIEGLVWDSNSIRWINKREINKQINDIYFASINDELECICVEAGKNFILDEVYYFLADGDLLFTYNKTNNRVEWSYKGCLYKKQFLKIRQAQIYLKQKVVLVIEEQNNKDRIIGYNLEGVKVFCSFASDGYSMEYLSEINYAPVVVCSGDENHVDKYGRNRVNFIIDEKTGIMSKANLAY